VGSTLRASHRGVLVVALAMSGTASTDPLSAQVTPELSTSDGVYSDAQSDRGKDVFGAVCSECHLPAEFKGAIDDWAGQSVFEVYEQIRTTMPEDGPGSLRNQEYADIVAYLFDLNGVPAGDGELAPEGDALRGIRVAAPPPRPR